MPKTVTAQKQWTFDDGYAEANGIRLHYASAGEGKPIIFLHGFPEHWYSWRYQIQALSEAGFQAIAPDLRGYNLSDRPDCGYDTGNLVQDIVDFATALELDEYYLVGHDWGGPISWLTAMRDPRVKRYCAVNGVHPGIFSRNLVTTTQLFRSWYMFVIQIPGLAERLLRRNDFRLLERVLKDGQRRSPKTITNADVEVLVKPMREPGALESALAYYRQAARLKNAKTQLSSLSKVSVPTCVVWSTKDPALIPDTEDKLRRWVTGPLELHYIEGAGHYVQQERPAELNEILTKFFS